LPSRRRRPVIALLTVALLVLPGANNPGPSSGDSGDQLVTLLDRMLSFIEWPEGAFPAPDSPIVIGFLGEPPFPPEALARRSVNGRAIRIERLDAPPADGTCHVLWMGGGVDPGTCPSPANTLTVSDRDDFVGHGGMIELRPGVPPGMDLSALGRSGLGAHPQLIDVSTVRR
jgi:hypothetical protein